MVDLEDFLWSFSIISLALYFVQTARKAIISMAALALNSPSPPPRSPSLLSPNHHLPWVREFFLEHGDQGPTSTNPSSLVTKDSSLSEVLVKVVEPRREAMILTDRGRSATSTSMKKSIKKRPTKLVLPEQYCPQSEFCAIDRKLENKEIEVEGRDFFLASKKGKREVMEDGYGIMVDISGDTKQAFFAVIDGHGGRAAADYVAENLGKNIVKEMGNAEEVGRAIRGGYSVTDKEFLSQGVGSGACVASVVLKDGEIHAANVGDCKVVLSRKGLAHALTHDHRVGREDETLRIQNSGGYLHCQNGTWRVQGSLAVSRAFGDQHLKQWVISEPEIKKVQLNSDCQFLILASDGLWDKVNEQEAVDVVLGHRDSEMESCKKLVDTSFSRGNKDDVTVMTTITRIVTNGSASASDGGEGVELEMTIKYDPDELMIEICKWDNLLVIPLDLDASTSNIRSWAKRYSPRVQINLSPKKSEHHII